MMSLKPINIFNYLHFKKNEVPKHIKRLFYLSWEDAFWDILAKKRVIKNSTILVPDFFCGDVEENIKKHGYSIAHYPVSTELKTTNEELIRSLKKHDPAVLVIFHAIGITNSLFCRLSWLKSVNKELILIEDSAHRIVNAYKIKFIKKNHIVIDSLRKVIPLQGSVVYSNNNDLDFVEPPIYQSFVYALIVTHLWVFMNVFWELAQIFSPTKLSAWFAYKANQIMKVGYNAIGDSILPARGFCLFSFLQQYIDLDKIEKVKKEQVEHYQKNLMGLPKKKYRQLPYRDSDKGKLYAYPLILPIRRANKILGEINRYGLLLNFELSDSVWSRKRKIIYLPLGLHLTRNNLDKVIHIVWSCI